MYTNFNRVSQRFPKVLGIYTIKNIVNGHLYVGSTANYRLRKYKHTTTLNKGIHHSAYLQRAYNKYGSKSFEFSLIEELKFPSNYDGKLIGEHLISREQYYIDTLQPVYNSVKEAGTSKGWRMTDAQREVVRQRNILGSHFKPVYKLDLRGNILAEYKCVKDACEANNRAHTCVSNLLKGRNGTRLDYTFCYKKDYGVDTRERRSTQ